MRRECETQQPELLQVRVLARHLAVLARTAQAITNILNLSGEAEAAEIACCNTVPESRLRYRRLVPVLGQCTVQCMASPQPTPVPTCESHVGANTGIDFTWYWQAGAWHRRMLPRKRCIPTLKAPKFDKYGFYSVLARGCMLLARSLKEEMHTGTHFELLFEGPQI